MLTAGLVTGNGKYFTDLAREDYYTKGGEPKGKWLGDATEHFGLEKRNVTNSQLRRSLAGFDPRLKKIERDKLGKLSKETLAAALVQNAGGKKRQAGYDLCYSTVKSESIAWVAAPDSVRKAMDQARWKSYRAGLEYLEENAAFTRRGKGGTETERVKLLVAAFPHCTSRAQDPQNHIHGVSPNFGLREDGSTGTLASWVFEDKFGNQQTYNPLMRHMKAAGALMRCENAYQLRNIGFSIERSEDGFSYEIEGIPKDACEFYSKRRAEIEEHLAEHGFESAEAAEIANKATRVTKDDISRPELFKTWRAELKEFGVTEELIQSITQEERAISKAQTIDQAIEKASQELGEEHGSFTEKQLVLRVANEMVAECVPAKAVTGRIEKEIFEGELVSLGKHHEERVLSTKENLQFEHEFLNSLKRSRDSQAHEISNEHVDQVLENRERKGEFSLTAEQTRALHYLVTGEDAKKSAGALRVLTGDAGTGKTTVLKSAKEAFELAGYKVRGACLSGNAADTLHLKTGMPSYTIDKWNIEHRKGKRAKPFELDSKTALVIDETVMADSSKLYKLQSEAERKGSIVLFIGDEKQCQAIGHGGAFVQAERMTHSVRLTEIHRQKDPADREVSRLQAEGKSGEALRNLSERNRVHVAATEAKAIDRIVHDWTKLGGTRDPKDHQVICNTHKQRLALNEKLQWERMNLFQRALGGYATNHEEQKLFAGDRVNFRETISFLQQNNSLAKQAVTELKRAVNQTAGTQVFQTRLKSEREQIRRGAFGTVVSVDPAGKTVKVSMDDGRLLDVPLFKKSEPGRKLFPTPEPLRKKEKTEIALAYAVTTHASQGGDFGHIYSLAGGSMQDRELSYVQMTRGEHRTTLYTTKELAGEELTLRSELHDAKANLDYEKIEKLEEKLTAAEKTKSSHIENSRLARTMSQSNQKDFALEELREDEQQQHGLTR